MDTEIIAKSPVRLTVSGMGDALATYFEARACQASGAWKQEHVHRLWKKSSKPTHY